MQFLGNLSRWAAGVALMFGLAACGPVTETHDDYQPPGSQAGMQCLAQCQQGQNQCTRAASEATQECRYSEERRVEEEYYAARDRYNEDRLLYAAAPEKFSKPTEPSKGYPSYYHCDNLGSQCQGNFNMCYRSCGGQVRERQVCVANCEE